MKTKIFETKYEVEEGGEGIDDEFTSKKDALDFINNEAMGKHFIVYKTTINRQIIKNINLKRPRPCYGGWHKGHHVSQEDRDKEIKNPFCGGCGYKLKRIYVNFEVNYILARPLEHIEDGKTGSKK